MEKVLPGVSSARLAARSSFYEEARPDVVIVDARGDQLRKIFYQLNEEGQSKLLSYALDLKKISGYLKKQE